MQRSVREGVQRACKRAQRAVAFGVRAAGLAGVDVGYHAEEGTLQIPEGIAANALNAGFVLDGIGQQVGQGTGSPIPAQMVPPECPRGFPKCET